MENPEQSRQQNAHHSEDSHHGRRDHHSSGRRHEFSLRMRTDSTGSTRGAFASQESASSVRLNPDEALGVRKRKKKTTQHQEKEKERSPMKYVDNMSSSQYSAAPPARNFQSGFRLEPIPDNSAELSIRNSHSTYGSLALSEGTFRSQQTQSQAMDSGQYDPSAARFLAGGDLNDTARFSVSSNRVSEISLGSLYGTSFLDNQSLRDSTSLQSMQQSDRSFQPFYPQNDVAALSSQTNAHGGAPAPFYPSQRPLEEYEDEDGSSTEYTEDESLFSQVDGTFTERVMKLLASLLTSDVKFDSEGHPYFDDYASYTMLGFFRHFFYNPLSPEFTSLQQFDWAVMIGVVMGIFTASWKALIEGGIDFFWETVPEYLLEIGMFTELDGPFPLYHYMWMCPAIFGGLLSYIFVVLPIKIPDQNEWIKSVHSRGIQDHRTFWTLIILSTFGMWSGLSLGPELPLVLTSGMVGSWLGLICKQSMLQARVMNLTAASAAIGGFFGFPMAGALFVLELPHRMGLQYFEALSPATIASIVAVLTNRMVTGNDVTGYFSYPFLTSTLPSEIFTSAIVYGFYGAAVGIFYAAAVIKLKTWVHDLFHAPHDEHHHHHHGNHTQNVSGEIGNTEEEAPLVKKMSSHRNSGHRTTVPDAGPILAKLHKYFCCTIPEESNRAAVAGTIAGALVGMIGILVPHTMFWGEAQLQNLIDKGRTPLPVFGEDDEPTAALVALGYCIIDNSDPEAVKAGFGIGCATLITLSKIAVIGLSLGTGIVGGHFWGPLFVGCAASHLLTDVVNAFADAFGFGRSLAAYPCVVILCTMGSAHVVTFRAHMAIMLILTLTISAFDPEGDVHSKYKVAGDYSAVFPLLVVSVFVALMVSRQTVFYKTQRSRGDIMAVPEVLCEPGMEGRPLVMDFEMSEGSSDYDGDSSDEDEDGSDPRESLQALGEPQDRRMDGELTAMDIEKAFLEASKSQRTAVARTESPGPPPPHVISRAEEGRSKGNISESKSDRLDELLSRPMDSESPDVPERRRSSAHRRTKSAPVQPEDLPPELPPTSRPSARTANRERTNSASSRGSLIRINSYGELQDHQPSLLDQARMRAASSAVETRHHRIPSLPSARHSRRNSESSVFSSSAASVGAQESGALSIEDIDKTFNSLVNDQLGGGAMYSNGKSPWSNS